MFLQVPTVEALAEAFDGLSLGADDGVLILLADEGAPDLDALVARLGRRGAPFFGGVFPGLIYDGAHRPTGALLLVLPLVQPPVLVQDLTSSLAGRLALPRVGAGRPTAVAFVDGLSPHAADWLRRIYAQIGTTMTTIGGGAGNLDFQPRPCVFSQDGVATDGGVIALSPLGCSVGVRHGWTEMAGPLVATRTTGNRVHELNWRPAGEVYQEAIGRTIPDGGFFDVAKGHPFGLRKEGQEDVVRDPLSMEADGTLVCAGEVPQNAVLTVLQGDPNSLIAAAKQATADALGGVAGEHRATLVIDCISRTIFLEGRLNEEMAVLGASGAPLVGALTLGEIASSGDTLLEWFNKTAVVGALYEGR